MEKKDGETPLERELRIYTKNEKKKEEKKKKAATENYMKEFPSLV